MRHSQVQIEELKELDALRQIPPEQLAVLASAMVRRSYAPGQLIFLEGDPSSGLWFIAAGRVRIIKQSLNGRVQGLCLIERGKCFGGCPLFDGATNPANAQALDDVTLMVLPRDRLQRLTRELPSLALTVLQIFNQRLAHLARIGEGLGGWSAAHRINDCILAYAEHSEPYPIVSLTHDKIATLAGTVREVVTRHLSSLEREGAIRVEPGRIILLDMERISGACLSGKT